MTVVSSPTAARVIPDLVGWSRSLVMAPLLLGALPYYAVRYISGCLLEGICAWHDEQPFAGRSA